jgi:hypothetical protein
MLEMAMNLEVVRTRVIEGEGVGSLEHDVDFGFA